jgi:hypothetical protein
MRFLRWLLKLAAGFLLIGLTSGLAHAGDSAVQMSTSHRVVVTTQTAGTTLLAADTMAKKTCLMNSTTDYLLIGDADTTFSTSATTGTFRLAGTPSGQVPQLVCLDGPGAPYRGVVRAVSGGSGSINIDVFRER